VKSVRFTDADGTLATLTWGGSGFAVVQFAGSGLTRLSGKGMVTVVGAAGLTAINAHGTGAATSLTIVTRGGNNAIDVGGLVSDGAFGKIVAKTSRLAGDLTIAGALKQVSLGSAQGGTLTAAAVGGAAVAGTFAASLNAGSLGTFRAGGIGVGTWNVSGSAKSIVTDTVSGLSATFGGTLIGMSVRKSSANTSIAGAAITSLNLGGVGTESRGVPVSVGAHTIKNLAGSAHGKHFALHGLTASSDAPALLAAQGVAAGDLVVQLD